MIQWVALIAVATGSGAVNVTITPRPDCPSALEVERDVQQLLGPEASVGGDASIQILDRGDGVVGVVRLQGKQSVQTRTLPGGSCTAVANAAALVIAVGLDPMGVSETLEPMLREPSSESFVPVPTPVPTPELPPAAPQAAVASPPAAQLDTARSTSTRQARFPRSVHGLVLGGPTFGLLPGPSGRLGGGIAVGVGRARFEVLGHHEFGRTVNQSDSVDSGATLSITSVRPSGCWTPAVRRFTFPLCLGVELGVVTGRGRRLQQNRVARSLWVAAVPSVRGLWHPVGWLGLGLAVEAPLSLRRPQFQIDDFMDPLVQVEPVGLFAGAVVQFTFFDESRSTRR